MHYYVVAFTNRAIVIRQRTHINTHTRMHIHAHTQARMHVYTPWMHTHTILMCALYACVTIGHCGWNSFETMAEINYESLRVSNNSNLNNMVKFGCSHPINLAEGLISTNLIRMHVIGSDNTCTSKSTSVAEIHCKTLTNVCAQQD